MSRQVSRALKALAFVAIVLAAGPASATRQMFGGEATPSRYDIRVAPDAEAGTFTGSVAIDVTTAEAGATISLNAHELHIESAKVDGRTARVSLDPEAQTMTLSTGRTIPAGAHRIEISYRGRIYDEAYGLFRVSYETADGSRRMLATQFEPGDARRFAPMWDQPDKRAVFVLSVDVPAGESAISNMPEAQRTALANGKTRVTFQPSPSMPSYLLFLGLGDFERITQNVDGVELSVVARRGEAHKGQEALRAGAESLRYFTEYFGIPYPLPKLDMIAIPGAGGFGAMENWGAILYFDQYLLLDDGSTEADRQTVFGFVAHEIAHQWFGNLVTMAWWDDLWLNEGFASWMATKAAEALHPDWEPWLGVFPDRNGAMEMDARAGTHPVVQEVNTIEQANLAFDEITYEKGQAVIRMLESYVGEEAFRQGVRNYIRSRLYGNAATTDLWRELQAASGQPIMEIARAYTLQEGFPVIEVSQSACTRDPRGVSLRQRRFATDAASRTGELWTIPITARRVGGAETLRLVAPATRDFIFSPPADGCGPLIVNAGQSAFFRTRYAQSDFDAITARFGSLAPIDQLGMLADYWAFGRAGEAPMTSYLALAQALPADAQPLVTLHVAGSLQSLAQLNSGRASDAALRAFAISRLKPVFARVGWDARAGEASNDAILRDTLIRVLGRLGDGDVVSEARRRVAAFAGDPSVLPGSIRDATFRAYAANANTAQHADLLARAAAEPNFVEKRRLYLYAAEARDPALARATLAMLNDETAPRPLRPTILQSVAGVHPELAWRFAAENRALVDSWLDTLRRLDYAPAIASQSSDPAVADEVTAYAQAFPADARQAAQGAAAAIRARSEMIARQMPGVDAWLAAHAPVRAAGSRGRQR